MRIKHCSNQSIIRRPYENLPLAKKAFKEFFSRPVYILRKILRIRSCQDLLGYAKGLKAILLHEFADSCNRKHDHRGECL